MLNKPYTTRCCDSLYVVEGIRNKENVYIYATKNKIKRHKSDFKCIYVRYTHTYVLFIKKFIY